MGGIGGIVMALLNVDAHTTLDSSVGRAVDCSCKCQTSIGRWFKSGSRECFFLLQSSVESYFFNSSAGVVATNSSIV